MNNILEKIILHKKIEVEAQKKALGTLMAEFEQAYIDMPDCKSLIEKLEEAKSRNQIGLIAEVKKASPSKGIIREDFKPVEIATAYEKAGACAISVLTDEKFFQGSIEYLKEIKKVVTLPILRKDFIIDEFQVYQTRNMGADIILLIAAALSPEKLKELYDLSLKIGLNVLLEVHNQREMEQALEIGAKIIGINNRNLETFEVDINTTANLIKNNDVSNHYIIAESGIFTHEDLKYLQEKNASGILVGESLMKQDNIELAVKNLLGL